MELYDATIPQFLQTVGAVAGLVDKAEAFCAERGIAPAEIVEARLAEDMLPFAYQVKSVAVHSAGAVAGVRQGQFSPDMSALPDGFDAMRALLAEARTTLDGLERDEVNGFAGRDMAFHFKERVIPFEGAEGFLLSFSQPNLYFHATAVYAILRWKGVPLGKTDFLGRMLIRR